MAAAMSGKGTSTSRISSGERPAFSARARMAESLMLPRVLMATVLPERSETDVTGEPAGTSRAWTSCVPATPSAPGAR